MMVPRNNKLILNKCWIYLFTYLPFANPEIHLPVLDLSSANLIEPASMDLSASSEMWDAQV